MRPKPEKRQVEATVTNIAGPKGKRYAVTVLTPSSPRPVGLDDNETITFSLTDWEGRHPPEKGQLTYLSDLVRFSKGWRAREARPVTT